MRLAYSPDLRPLEPPTPWDCTWEELAGALTAPPLVTAQRDAVPLWSPAERKPNAPSTKDRHVVQIHAAVLDFDDVPMSTLADVRTIVERLGWEAVMHSTWRSAEAYPKSRARFRVVCPLLRPVPKDAWRTTWHKLASLFPTLDTQCKDIGRRYFFPATPALGPHVYSWRIPGEPIDPKRLPDPSVLPKPVRKVTRDEILDLAKRWTRSKSHTRKRLGEALKAVADGVPFADHGNRDVTAFQLTNDIVRSIPDADPQSVEALFAPSLSLMGPDVPDLGAKARAARRNLEESTPANPTQDPQILVTPTGGAYYVSHNHRWIGPYQGDAVDVAIAEAFPVEDQFDSDGKLRTRAAMLRTYGTKIDRHFYQLGEAESQYQDGEFRERAAPVRQDLEPAYSPLAAEYLSALADNTPKRAADLLTWLAVLPDLREPLAALALIGRRGGGKSLFAECCSTLWTNTGPTSATVALSDWNVELLDCPLVFADEYLPDGEITGKLREIIQARSHVIKRKYLPNVAARGSIRLVIAANSESILTFDENLSPEDIAAVAERFYVLPITDVAHAWHERNPEGAQRLKNDEFARHVLWLSKNLTRVKDGRFWVRGGQNTLDMLATRGGVRSDLCRWIVEWLARPRALQQATPHTQSHIDAHGRILLSLNEVFSYWETYLPREQRYRLGEIREALRVIAPNQTRRSGGTVGRFWIVDDGRLDRWIEDSGWAGLSVAELKTKFNLDIKVIAN